MNRFSLARTGFKFLTLAILLLWGCRPLKQYINHVGNTITPEKIYYTDFTRKTIQQNPREFTWYDTTYHSYHPDTLKILALKPMASHMSFRVFGGSWCSDTKKLLPKFYRITDAIGIPDSLINLSGVDRHKSSENISAERYLVNRIPVFILYYDGMEAGRIIEKVKKSMEADMLTVYEAYLKLKK
jgi:hypothetical protein